jgi:EAL domain-containing protein (putative c-di-GMP-specific phosphodiesterase class I)
LIRLAEDMGFDVIAEGVETQVQADLLTEFGCHLAQGYLFSRPLPLTELLAGPPRTANIELPAQRPGSDLRADVR